MRIGRSTLAWGTAAMPLAAKEGDRYIDLYTDIEYVYTGEKWVKKSELEAPKKPAAAKSRKKSTAKAADK